MRISLLVALRTACITVLGIFHASSALNPRSMPLAVHSNPVYRSRGFGRNELVTTHLRSPDTMASLVGSRGAAARVLRGTPGILSGLPPVAYLLTRNASSRAPITDKTRILEKPAKFNPPSHGSRRVRPRAYPGAPLGEQEREAQNEKRYPNMMPPEGSFSRWFLTNRTLHLWITLVRSPQLFHTPR